MSNRVRQAFQAAAGAAGGDPVTIDQVFSTDLFDGTGSSQGIVNGLDLSGEGGLVWTKIRNLNDGNHLFDTERGSGKYLISNEAGNESTSSSELTSFNNNGFTYGAYANNYDVVGWSFRKAPKFFDVVKFSGSGGGAAIPHSLGSIPAMYIVKRTDGAGQWFTYHKDVDSSSPEDYWLKLNGSDARATGGYFNNTLPTATHFSVGSSANNSGENYIAYLWADNSSEDAADRMIACGSYTGNGSSTGPVVDLGFEPQWLMIKSATTSKEWRIHDTMRGMPVSGSGKFLEANSSNAESGDTGPVALSATGFQLTQGGSETNASGATYIFMAVRRDDMAEVTDATKLFGISSNFISSYSNVGFPVDMVLGRKHQQSNNWRNFARLIGDNFLVPNLTNAQQQLSNEIRWDDNSGFYQQTNGTPNIWYQWKRAKSFFESVCYTGTGSARTVAHGLGVTPEMMWIKSRSSAESWGVYHGDETNYMTFNNELSDDSAAFWNDTAPTSSVFTVNTQGIVNNNNRNYIAYLFATLAGVSKVGSFTGTNSAALNVDCGFTNSARFVLIKRTDASGGWYVFDSVRGIASWPTDTPYLFLNSNAAQVLNTNHITAHSSGFTVVQQGSGPFSSGTFIFYAIA